MELKTYVLDGKRYALLNDKLVPIEGTAQAATEVSAAPVAPAPVAPAPPKLSMDEKILLALLDKDMAFNELEKAITTDGHYAAHSFNAALCHLRNDGLVAYRSYSRDAGKPVVLMHDGMKRARQLAAEQYVDRPVHITVPVEQPPKVKVRREEHRDSVNAEWITEKLRQSTVGMTKSELTEYAKVEGKYHATMTLILGSMLVHSKVIEINGLYRVA